MSTREVVLCAIARVSDDHNFICPTYKALAYEVTLLKMVSQVHVQATWYEMTSQNNRSNIP